MRTPPVQQVNNMIAATFFGRLARLMKWNPPADADADIVRSLATLGVTPGQTFDVTRLEPEAIRAMDDGFGAGKARLLEFARHPRGKMVSGWNWATVIGAYGVDYEQRAAIAYFGLGANTREDAVYPMTRVDSMGNSLHGAHRYVLHFDKGRTPPVNAFWSITMYNDRANPIHRFAIGDRDDLRYNADGSLDIYIQAAFPGRERESNWLPAPAGLFNLILRLYWPKQDVLDGVWQPPAVQMVQ
jgi:hypothetical protein